jgi:CBS domain-containing protein
MNIKRKTLSIFWIVAAPLLRRARIQRGPGTSTDQGGLTMNVKEAMTAQVKVCRPETSLDEIARLMWETDCGAIPVIAEDHKPIGIVTDRDIAMAAMHNHQPLWDIQASKVIQGQEPCCCSHKESLESCLETMERHKVRRLMVTDDRGALCGILSMGDAVSCTNQQKASWGKTSVSAEPVLDMLRQVSGHNSSSDRPALRL